MNKDQNQEKNQEKIPDYNLVEINMKAYNEIHCNRKHIVLLVDNDQINRYINNIQNIS